MKTFLCALALLAMVAPAVASGPTTMNWEYYRRCSDQTKPSDQRIVECSRAMTFEKTFGVKAEFALYVDRALAYRDKGESAKALDDLNYAISLNRYSVPALDDRATVYRDLGQYQNSLDDFTQALKYSPSHVPAFVGRALTYASMGDYDHAMQDFDSAAAADPDDSSVPAGRCLVRVLRGNDLNAARMDCDRALHLSPKDADTLRLRGMVFFKMGDYPNAIADTTSALAIDMRDGSALYLRGLAKAKIGDATSTADLADSKTFDPGAADYYASFGVTP
ncbi:MAG TPA: tetratricopeptide repeat protein [Rhizomicrobium sp.]|nr:tetratricopeptide repeat protein [Rhizomicrobium sp.]